MPDTSTPPGGPPTFKQPRRQQPPRSRHLGAAYPSIPPDVRSSSRSQIDPYACRPSLGGECVSLLGPSGLPSRCGERHRASAYLLGRCGWAGFRWVGGWGRGLCAAPFWRSVYASRSDYSIERNRRRPFTRTIVIAMRPMTRRIAPITIRAELATRPTPRKDPPTIIGTQAAADPQNTDFQTVNRADSSLIRGSPASGCECATAI
jgi:hypothetical protein